MLSMQVSFPTAIIYGKPNVPAENTWFTGPAIAVTRWYVVHLMIAGTWSTVANLIDDFCRALTLADGKLSSKNPPWWQVPNFVFLFMDVFALSSPTHYVLREFENKYSLIIVKVKPHLIFFLAVSILMEVVGCWVELYFSLIRNCFTRNKLKVVRCNWYSYSNWYYNY